MNTERRLSQRHQTRAMMSNIYDGRAGVIGVVDDISREGIRISNIPASFEEQSTICISIVNGPHRNHYLTLHPRWTRKTNKGMYKMIGFRIREIPPSWTRLVGNIESDKCAEDLYCSIVVDGVEET